MIPNKQSWIIPRKEQEDQFTPMKSNLPFLSGCMSLLKTRRTSLRGRGKWDEVLLDVIREEEFKVNPTLHRHDLSKPMSSIFNMNDSHFHVPTLPLMTHASTFEVYSTNLTSMNYPDSHWSISSILSKFLKTFKEKSINQIINDISSSSYSCKSLNISMSPTSHRMVKLIIKPINSSKINWSLGSSFSSYLYLQLEDNNNESINLPLTLTSSLDSSYNYLTISQPNSFINQSNSLTQFQITVTGSMNIDTPVIIISRQLSSSTLYLRHSNNQIRADPLPSRTSLSSSIFELDSTWILTGYKTIIINENNSDNFDFHKDENIGNTQDQLEKKMKRVSKSHTPVIISSNQNQPTRTSVLKISSSASLSSTTTTTSVYASSTHVSDDNVDNYENYDNIIVNIDDDIHIVEKFNLDKKSPMMINPAPIFFISDSTSIAPPLSTIIPIHLSNFFTAVTGIPIYPLPPTHCITPPHTHYNLRHSSSFPIPYTLQGVSSSASSSVISAHPPNPPPTHIVKRISSAAPLRERGGISSFVSLDQVSIDLIIYIDSVIRKMMGVGHGTRGYTLGYIEFICQNDGMEISKHKDGVNDSDFSVVVALAGAGNVTLWQPHPSSTSAPLPSPLPIPLTRKRKLSSNSLCPSTFSFSLTPCRFYIFQPSTVFHSVSKPIPLPSLSPSSSYQLKSSISHRLVMSMRYFYI